MYHSPHAPEDSSSVQLRFARAIVAEAGVVDIDQEALLVQAFQSVPRQAFFAKKFIGRAYDDIALPIGENQSSTRPSTVARVLSLAHISKGSRVLEIGTGSGYGAALMTVLGASVFTVERVAHLAQSARKVLDRTSYHAAIVQTGDPARGWSEHAPYDAIISWLNFDEVPREVLRQLSDADGRWVGTLNGRLAVIEKQGESVRRVNFEELILPRSANR